MGTNAVIDVAIGIILMYLVLSLICTVLNEFIATGLKLRAKVLQNGLEQILDDPVLKADFYNHGLIDGAKAANGGDNVSYLSGRTFAMALVGSLDVTKPLPVFSDVESAIKNLPDSNIRDTLLAHLATAQGDLEKLRDAIATWFDHAMDRVGGIYKRHLKLISVSVGFLLALAINADSIAVGNSLWHDSALRAQMVSSAASIVAAKPPASQPAAGSAPGELSTVIGSIQDAEEKLRPLPVGWSFSAATFEKQPNSAIAAWLGVKIVGLLLTAAALSLGAPFWFDLLSKFVNLRGTGEKPKRTADE